MSDAQKITQDAVKAKNVFRALVERAPVTWTVIALIVGAIIGHVI